MALTVANPTAGKLDIVGAVVIGTIVDGVFTPYDGGSGPTIPSTSNLLKGDGSGGVSDSGVTGVGGGGGGSIAFGTTGTRSTITGNGIADQSYGLPNRTGTIAVTTVAPVADGTYTVGLGVGTNGTITVNGGIITAVQEATP